MSFTSTARWTLFRYRVIETELILADLQTLERRCRGWRRRSATTKRKPVHEAAVAAQAVLNSGTTLSASRAQGGQRLLRELNLLTTKPFLYVFNADESVLRDETRLAELRTLVAPADARCSSTPRSKPSCRNSTTSPPPNYWSPSANTNEGWMPWHARFSHP